jgi:sulfhydrogenase subunit delta
VIEFRHMKALATNNLLTRLDVAFIEGDISSESQAKKARRIRENAEYVVEIGACAAQNSHRQAGTNSPASK